MKSKLALIQPTEYNNLFSSYHDNTKNYRFKKYNLPKITKLFTSTSTQTNNKKFNNLKLKLKTNGNNNIINENNTHFVYPLLNISTTKRTMAKTNTNLESIKYDMEKLRNIGNSNLIKKINIGRKNNIHKLKMVYLNLFNIKSENKINSIVNFDSFFNSIDSFEMKNNEEEKVLSEKLKNINNKSIIKIIDIFNETNFDKLNNDFSSISNIQQSYLNRFAEKLLNKYKDNNNININRDDNSINSFNKSQESSILTYNNVFFEWILDNVKHKIELKNEHNQILTTVWIQNLINGEINELKNKFIEFKQSLNLTNYIESQRKNKSNINRIGIKKDDSYFTTSTYGTNLNFSKIKSSINNNSNIISNYNSSRDYDENNKMLNNKNYTLNEMNAGFDFFDNKKNGATIKQINTKKTTFVIKKNINNGDISNRTSSNLNKIQSKNSFQKTKNKTELNNEYHGENTDLFKNLYVNKPRKNKIKSFKMNIPDNINNKNSNINKELNNNNISSSKKNIDIFAKTNKISNNNNSTDSDNEMDDDNSFITIEKAKSQYNKRNSINFIPIEFTPFQTMKIDLPNNNNDFSDSKKESKRDIASKMKLKRRGSETSRKPKFKNNIIYNKIVKSIFKHGKYKPKKVEKDEDSEDSSSDNEDSDYSDESSEIEENEDDNYQLNNNSKISKSKIKKQIDKTKKKKKRKDNNNTNKISSNKKEITTGDEEIKNKNKKKKKKKEKKKDKLLDKNEIIKEENKNELLNKIEKSELIKNLNQNFILNKGKKSKFTPEDINELKKLFTKNKNDNNENKKEKSKKEKKEKNKKEINKNEKNKKENKNNKENKKTNKKKRIISSKDRINEEGEEEGRKEEMEEEQEQEDEEPTIYSISSNENEDEDINENLQIKNEVDIMNLLLGNNESKKLFNDIYDMKQLLRKKDKTEEDKEAIKENKKQMKVVIDKYFDTLISKLTVNDLKKQSIHINILNELQLIQKYGIYSKRDLNKLLKRIMAQRLEEDNENARYNKFYYYDEYDEYFGKKEKKKRIMKKSKSAEVKPKKNAFKKFINLKYDSIKSKLKEKKKKLIYDNSYLYKDNYSDNEDNNFIIKKEIQDILNKEYNEIIKAKKEEIFKEKKRKDREIFFKKKVPFKKKTKKRQILRIVDDSINEEVLNKKNVDEEAMKKELEKEKERDRKLYEFFGKIQNLKNRRDSQDENKLNKFIDHEIERTLKSRTKQRLYYFLEEFNLNRMRARFNSNYKKIGYLSPIIFTSPNENNVNNLK